MNILFLGNGVHESERIWKNALQNKAITHLNMQEDGLFHHEGRPTDVISHLPRSTVVINFPHYDNHDHYSQMIKHHGLPLLSHKIEFHHLFPDQEKINSLAKQYGFKQPHSIRVKSEDVGEKLFRELALKIHLPVRARSYGKANDYEYYANTFPALYKSLEELRKESKEIDIYRDVSGDKLTIFTLPNFRGQEIYLTMPGVHSSSGFKLLNNFRGEAERQVKSLARELHHVFSPVEILRLDFKLSNKNNYLYNLEPVSPLKHSPTLLESFKFAGITVKEYYNHLLEKIVK